MSIHGPARHPQFSENIYAFSHPVGFYQKIQVLCNLRRLLERNHVSLADCPRIVDLGCGDGFMLRTMAELRGRDEGLVGIDLASDRLHAARQLNDGIRYVRSDMRRLPLADHSCDLVTAFVSFMYLATAEDVRQAACNIFRVLNPHGRLIVFVLVRGRDGRHGLPSLPTREIITQAERAGFELLDRQTCFKNILGFKRLCTAYLPARFPIPLVLLLERLPFSPANNTFLLFQKA